MTVGDLEVHIEGEGAETIVMVHGWPDTYRLWDGQVEALKSRYRCVRFTLPGFDRDQPRRAYSLDEVVDRIAAVVDAVSPHDPVTLLLHDWGCAFGYQYVMRHPQRVARLVGIDVGDANSKAFLGSLTAAAKLYIVAYQNWLALAWRLGPRLGDPMTRWMARKARARSDMSRVSSHMNYPYYIQWTGACGGYRGRMKALVPPCPMLFSYGTRKPFLFHSPRWPEEIAARPGSRVVPLPSGHWVMVEAGDAFNAVLLDWLNATPAAASATASTT
jgi:pimeloyl-ACP methyl ester carboxylesterase